MARKEKCIWESPWQCPLPQRPTLWQLPSSVTHPICLRVFGEEQGTWSSSTGTHSTSPSVSAWICQTSRLGNLRRAKPRDRVCLLVALLGSQWVSSNRLLPVTVWGRDFQPSLSYSRLCHVSPRHSSISHIVGFYLKESKKSPPKSTFFTILCIRHPSRWSIRPLPTQNHATVLWFHDSEHNWTEQTMAFGRHMGFKNRNQTYTWIKWHG